ncbi:unnamed protein product [Rhizopus stolonifer]
MSDHGSTYTVLQNVPVMVSPHYRLPKKIIIASELKPVPDSISQLVSYPFSIERQAIANSEAFRKRSIEEEELLRAKRIQYEEEKSNERKVAARKIAPGFLDTDTRILTPEQKYVQMPEPEEEPVSQPVLENSFDKPFDYLKFEQGLSPADPWDTPENDFVALRSVLSSPGTNYNTPIYPQYQPRSFSKNEGAYWNIQNGVAYSQGLSPNSVPAIPPKLFNSPMPSSTTSSPVITHPITSPPVPPLPNTAYEHLIEELNNMGFTRLQAIDALEKNDHDLIKATNFLLDQA